jgi:Cdc6-like AAA superfamily ATPase
MSGITLGGPSRHQPNTAPSKNANTEPKQFNRSKGRKKKSQLVVIYGTGGVGKTSLAALAPDPVFIDLENGSTELDIARIDNPKWTFAELCNCLQNLDNFTNDKTVVIDSVTRVEELIIEHIVAQHDTYTSIDDYDYQKGWQLLCDEFGRFLALINRLIANSKNVILIAHDTTTRFENPDGHNYIRFEPRLYHNPRKPTQSIMLRLKESCDHMLFIKYDVSADKAGKATGKGTRAVYCQERPAFMAKSRSLNQFEYPYTKNQDPILHHIFGE